MNVSSDMIGNQSYSHSTSSASNKTNELWRNNDSSIEQTASKVLSDSFTAKNNNEKSPREVTAVDTSTGKKNKSYGRYSIKFKLKLTFRGLKTPFF